MPDLDPLPPAPRRPSLPPRPGDLDDLRRRAVRRRAGRYGAAGSAVAVAAAVTVLLGNGPHGSHTIVADPDDPPPGATATATAPATPGASGSAEPSPVGEPTSAPAEPVPSHAPTGRPTPTATAAPSPSASSVPPAEPHLSVARDEVAYTPGGCSGALQGPGWCVRLPASRSVQAGEPSDYLAYACRLPGSGGGTMTFYSRDELYFTVSDQESRERFRHGGTGTAPTHSVAVPAGRCARWTMTYDTTDQAGRPLEPGDYSGSMSVYAVFSGATTGSSSQGFGITVTE